VHYLLQKGYDHSLTNFYPSLCNNPRSGDPFPDFRAFCLAYNNKILNLITTRRVQTNEVRRCVFLMPAFGMVYNLGQHQPLAQIDIGTSAGLNLLWDQYEYDYGVGRRYGHPDAPVQIQSELRGPTTPLILDPLPPVNFRTGLDLHPVDVRDPDQADWLRALIWPEHHDRRQMLSAAIQMFTNNPHTLCAGNALQTLPKAISEAPQNTTLCVFHSFALNQFSSDMREQLESILLIHSESRPIYRISAEGNRLDLFTYTQGECTSRQLAEVHAHGRWTNWLA
ncbi:MAG: DUF2332 domain-containing protein, partial [Candidatus Latescibacteria bacterium]|nr:DUF2332 domain-containing protein [Candidatus Latescibacterota bacterium]